MIYNFHHNSDWSTIWTALGVIVALILGVVGIFQDWVRAWIKKPNLNISIKLSSPDCVKTFLRYPVTDQFYCDAYYLRFRVENNGNYQAEDVEAVVVELHKKVGNVYEKVVNFLPLNLLWVPNSASQITKPKIQPSLFKYLDFGHIVKSEFADLGSYGFDNKKKVVFILDTEAPPNTGSHIIFPGEYIIKIKFAGNNLKLIEKSYKLMIEDDWIDNETAMLQNIIQIVEYNSKNI